MGNRHPGEKKDKMKQILILILLILSAGATAFAQGGAKTNDDAAAVPDRLFTAMRAKNADGIRAVFIPEGQLVAIDKPRDGKGLSKTRVFTADAFAKRIADGAGEYVEKMPEKSLTVTGDMAMVSGRYTFYVGDKFSHCGTNTFHLVRTDAGWKIANGASTLEFQCETDLKAVEIPVVAPDPADVSTIDGMIKAFYETISGPKGQPRQWSRDRPLYTKGVRFIEIGKPKDVRVDIMEYMEYVNGSNEFFLKDGFTEREIHRVAHRFGNIAQVFSTYEWQTDGKKASGRGINSIELFFDGARWWISAASWEGERKDNPIPKEFLPAGKR
jgi:hypothetical protein